MFTHHLLTVVVEVDEVVLVDVDEEEDDDDDDVALIYATVDIVVAVDTIDSNIKNNEQ